MHGWGLVAVMFLAELYAAPGPAPATPDAAAEIALFAYLVLAAMAAVVDRIRNTSRFASNLDLNRLAEQSLSG